MRNHILITINVVDRQGGEHILTTKPGQSTLMDVLYDEDLDVEAVCGGCASCATCHIFVNEDCLDRLPERDDIQNMLLQYQGNLLNMDMRKLILKNSQMFMLLILAQ